MATKMKMVDKGGKMVPAFAADGKGKMMMGGTKKYQDGGKVTRGDIKDAQREAKLKRIQAGTEPSTYQKVSDIAGKVADTAVSASQTAKAISDTRRPSGAGGPGGMKKGGIVKKPVSKKMMMGGNSKYQNGGPVAARNRAMGKKEPSLKKTLDYVKKNGSGYIPSNPATKKPNTESYKSAGTSIKTAKRPDTKYYKVGGMVNSNAKISADKTPGSKGVKSGVNPKIAKPKMAMGGTRPGMAKAGSTKYQTGGPTAEQQIESGARKNYMANAKAKLMGVAAAARKSSGRKGKI